MKSPHLATALAAASLPFAVSVVLAAGPAPAAVSPPEERVGSTAPARLADLAWMSGRWAGTAGGVQMEELWTEPAGGVMVGVHRDVFAPDRAFFEYLRIERDAEGIVYLASPRGRSPATPFRLEEHGARWVVFANPAHDFPQRISYWLEGEDLLHARIEGQQGGQAAASEWAWRRAR